MKDYYTILGLDRSASAVDVKKAYRKLAMKHHPDRGGDSTVFAKMTEAYETLSDPQKRNAYDNPQGFYSKRHNFEDIMDQYFRHTSSRQHSQETRVSIWIGLEDAVIGDLKIISLNVPGQTSGLEIKIPPGIHDNENVRYPGLMPGGHDLIVNFRVHGHPLWQRDGLDLLCETQVDFWQLLLGSKTTINTITGKKLNLTIPPRTNPDSILRLKQQGIQREGHNPGDVFVKLKAVLPTNISDEVIDFLSKHTTNK